MEFLFSFKKEMRLEVSMINKKCIGECQCVKGGSVKCEAVCKRKNERSISMRIKKCKQVYECEAVKRV